jgi:asparagine synthase (glutamine-hydrolysing)
VSGTAKSWYQEIQERIPDSGPKQTFWYLTPQTEEAYYYRSIFHQHYGAEGEKVLSYFWMPKWSGETKDPSARTLSLY